MEGGVSTTSNSQQLNAQNNVDIENQWEAQLSTPDGTSYSQKYQEVENEVGRMIVNMGIEQMKSPLTNPMNVSGELE